jgi:hypothetical protein
MMDECGEDMWLQLVFVNIADTTHVNAELFHTYPMVHPQPRNDIEQDDGFWSEQIT